jgi:hypothetical protein
MKNEGRKKECNLDMWKALLKNPRKERKKSRPCITFQSTGPSAFTYQNSDLCPHSASVCSVPNTGRAVLPNISTPSLQALDSRYVSEWWRLQYLRRNPERRREWRKENPVLRGGDINTGTWSSRLEVESRLTNLLRRRKPLVRKA